MSSTNGFLDLLQSFSDLDKELTQKRISMYEGLTCDYFKLLQDEYVKRKSTADKFNPIELLKLQNDELTHSNILAWALDPLETHNQGDLFFKYFLKNIPFKISYQPYDYKVLREYSGIESIIDILIYGPQFILYIENKVSSPEGPNQSHREYKDLLRLAEGMKIKNIGAIYLNPSGRMPENRNWIPVSYRSLANCFRQSIPEVKAQYVRLFISSWISVLNSLEG